MPFYQIENTTGSPYSSVSLTLAAHTTTVVNVPSLGADLNTAIIAGTLVAKKLGSGTTVTVDFTTNVITASTPASLVSQEIIAAQSSRLPPGVEVTNNTTGDIAIRASASAAAFTPGNYDEILAPGEVTYITADYVGAVQAICETNSGSIKIRAFY